MIVTSATCDSNGHSVKTQNTEKVTEVEFTASASQDTLSNKVVVPGSDNLFPRGLKER